MKLKFVGQRHDLIRTTVPKEVEATHIVDETATFYGENGQIIGFLIKGWDKTSEMVSHFKKIKYSKSARTGGMIQHSATFGFMPRNAVRWDYCRASRIYKDYPDTGISLNNMAERISAWMSESFPEVYEINKNIVQEVKSCWRIGDSLFTSGIINKNNYLQYHVDFGNFDGSWSAMLSYKKGITGGDLHLPEFDALLRLSDGDLLAFKGGDYVHGVTPFYRTEVDPYRYTCVFYNLRELCKCLDPREELVRYKQLTTKQAMDLNRDKLLKSTKKKAKTT